MLSPDTLPPEIWHHIASIEPVESSELIPWLQVSPLTYAKGMHDAAFAVVFRDLSLSVHDERQWLEVSLLLSRYAREHQLGRAVRQISVHWNAAFLKDRADGQSIDTFEFGRLKKMSRMMEELICESFKEFKGLRELEWSNNTGLEPQRLSPRLRGCLEDCLATLTSLELSLCAFDSPLDLRSATSLSSLNMSSVRLASSAASSPSILLNAKLNSLILMRTISRVASGPWSRFFAYSDPEDPASDILTSFDLSEIHFLQIGHDTRLTQSDLEHVFHPTHSPRSLGVRMHTLKLIEVGRDTIAALSQARGFPALRELRIELLTDVVNEAFAEQVVTDMFNFVGRQTMLERLAVYFSDLGSFEDFDSPHSKAFESALSGAHVRQTLSRLQNLRRLVFGGLKFCLRYPMLDASLAPAFPALQTLIFNCARTINLTENVIDEVCQAVNHYPNLSRFGFYVDFRSIYDDDDEVEMIVQCFTKALTRHAPRVQYFTLAGAHFRLKHGVEGISRYDQDFEQACDDLYVFT